MLANESKQSCLKKETETEISKDPSESSKTLNALYHRGHGSVLCKATKKNVKAFTDFSSHRHCIVKNPMMTVTWGILCSAHIDLENILSNNSHNKTSSFPRHHHHRRRRCCRHCHHRRRRRWCRHHHRPRHQCFQEALTKSGSVGEEIYSNLDPPQSHIKWVNGQWQ